MPLLIVRQDITNMCVDAIVNAANSTLMGGGGVDGAIHRVAGPKLLEECKKLGGCATGEAKVTKGYDLPCKYVIHTVSPVWFGGKRGEAEALASCYRNSLQLALRKRCRSVAFPLISTGAYGYPRDEALKIAVDTVADFLLKEEMTVYLVFYDKYSFQLGQKLFTDITRYIDDHYVEAHPDPRRDAVCCRRMEDVPPPMARNYVSCAPQPEQSAPDLKNLLQNLDESFSEMLLRKIDEKGMTDAECYKRANVDRKHFSKIRKDKHYRPSKPTALAFAVALELSLAETGDLLKKAGYALSRSNKFDVILEYFIGSGNYDIFEINEVLFAFDQHLLGV